VKGETTEALVRDALAKVGEGWRFVRFDLPTQGENVFDSRTAVREGVAQVAAVREAVGEEIEIIIDVHTRLDPVDAIVLCRGLECYRPYFVEDPIRAESPGSLRRLREQTAVPIAVGEQFDSKWAFREVIENDWTDYARIDLCIAGGITEAVKIAGWCETHSIAVAPHNPLGPVSTAACLHLDLALSNFAVQECARVPGQVLPELFPVQVPFESGFLLPPARPGLGVVFDESRVADFPPIIDGNSPRLHRTDGSFTNW
jgi:galactonate dehydratase